MEDYGNVPYTAQEYTVGRKAVCLSKVFYYIVLSPFLR